MAIHRLMQQVANAAGVSRGAVQQWERVDSTAPKRGNQPLAAKLLGICAAEQVSSGTHVGGGVDARGQQVPLVSEVEAGSHTVIDNDQPHPKFDKVHLSVPVQRYTHALRVHGDSMVNEIGESVPEVSLIIVEPELRALPGDYVIAPSSENETTFKQPITDGGAVFLKPLNLRCPVKPLRSARVIGAVRAFTKRFGSPGAWWAPARSSPQPMDRSRSPCSAACAGGPNPPRTGGPRCSARSSLSAASRLSLIRASAWRPTCCSRCSSRSCRSIRNCRARTPVPARV